MPHASFLIWRVYSRQGCVGSTEPAPVPEFLVPAHAVAGTKIRVTHGELCYNVIVPAGAAPGSRLGLKIEVPALVQKCEFACDGNGIGLTLAACARGLLVLAFAPLANGALGPAVHTGDQLVPGDVIVRVGGVAVRPDMLHGGALRVPHRGKLTLEYERRAPSQCTQKLGGGRPKLLEVRALSPTSACVVCISIYFIGVLCHAAPTGTPQLLVYATQAKHGGGKAKRKVGAGLGGAPGVVAKKPAHARASKKPAVKSKSTAGAGAPCPKAKERLHARVTAVKEGLLAQSKLHGKAKSDRDEELETATYID